MALVAAGLVALVVYLDDRGADSDLVELPRDLPFEDGVYCVHDQGFCVSESREGELIALDTLTTNPYFRERGCTVSWRWIGEPDVAAYQLPPGEKSAFYEGCGGAVFDRDGLPGFGPAWRALDRYPLEVTGNTIVVDLGMRIEGKPRPTSQR